MRFDIMTLFPDLVDNVLSESIIGRARQAGLIEVCAHNIRDYSKDKHRRVDDTPYGGGMGMLMAAPPVYDCYEAIEKKPKTRTVYMSPKGSVFTQKKARELSEYDQLIILCGHYEGVDQRVLDRIIDEEISVGDYVLTGGEIPACIVVDAVARLKEGVLSDPECYENESLCQGMLEYPQYTRPYEFMGERVPEVLLHGNHKEIEKWRFKAALELTKKQRPDLL
ncbi:MAG: tRNA (guanosine(37)-N1)-methyltransferase TrmD [Clostridia bacterium]|nr:tRNA (guanosine(37)-N1)-methyltransferase TrmD [Clostridia bacterium]